MKHISPTKTIEQPIFKAPLQLNPEAIDRRLMTEKNLTYADFQALEGDLIEVHKPYWWDLASLSSAQTKQLHPESKFALESFDFWLIRFTLSILPFGDNSIPWLRFFAKLSCPDSQVSPQVHSLFPMQSVSNRQARIGPDLCFATDVPESDAIAVVKVASSEKFEISGAPVPPAKVTWDVRGYRAGNLVETYAVVKKTKQSSLQAEFGFNAQVKTEGGQLAASGRSELGGMIYVF